MGRKPTGRPSKRPKINIDWAKIDAKLIAGCDGAETAYSFGFHPNTLYRQCEETWGISFSAYLQEKKSKGDALLKEKQFAKAMGLSTSGDNTLLVWLGKTRLKQREHDDKEISLADQSIENTLERAKLKAENAELRKLINERNESKANDVHLQGEQTPEHLVRSGQIGEDIQ